MNIKLFGKKDFSLLMSAKVASNVGTQMQEFALSLYVLKITGSATKFASILAIAIVPQIILGPIAGVFVDRADRKKIIIYLDILCGIIVGATATLYMYNGKLYMLNIYFLVFILAVISAIYNPAVGTILPSILDKELLMDGISINSLINNIVGIIAPSVAGLVYGFFGIFIVLVINAASFILSAAVEIFMRIPKVKHEDKEKGMSAAVFKKDFMEGISFIRKETLIKNIIFIAVIVNFVFTAIFSVGFTYMAKQIFKITDSQYGYCESILVLSAMAAPFIAPVVAKKLNLGKIIFWDIFITSVLILLLAMPPAPVYMNLFSSYKIPFISMMTITVVIMIITTIGNIALNTVTSKKVPLAMMGRVNSVMNSSCMSAMPLGQMIAGIMFDIAPAWICIIVGGIISLIAILIFRRSLLDYREDSDDKLEKLSVEEANV